MKQVLIISSIRWCALSTLFLCTYTTPAKIVYTGIITGSHTKKHTHAYANKHASHFDKYFDKCASTARDTTSTRKCRLKQHCDTATLIIPRSVGANTARELVGWQEYLHQYTSLNSCGAYAQAVGYSRSFDPENITRTLFGSNTIPLLGSAVADKRSSSTGVYADMLGLSPCFKGRVVFCPVIENFFIDNQFFLGLDPLLCNFYLRVHAPFVHTCWNLHMHTKALSPAKQTILNPTSDSMPGAQEKLRFGKFSTHGLSKTGFADIDLIVGYDYWRTPFGHFGAFIQAVLPTGNTPDPRFIFSPVIGNGGHFELGAGLSGHLVVWQNCFCDTLTVYLEANVTHLFSNTQCRSFNLCRKGALNRYAPVYLKNNTLVSPAINHTTYTVDSRVSVKGDASVKLAYQSQRFSIDLGYNFYGNTTEKLCIKKACSRARHTLKLINIDVDSGKAPATATHKFFTYFGYHALTHENYYAYFMGLGVEVEVNALSCAERASVNQWSTYLKGGIAF